MTKVEASIFISGVPQEVYKFTKQLERFPEFIPDIKEVKVVSRDVNSTVTEWASEIEGITIYWKEKDNFDDDNLVISYYLLEGDLDKFEGKWSFKPQDGGTLVTLEVNYDFGLPTFTSIMGPLLKIKVKGNVEAMLKAIKKEFELDKSGTK